MIESKFPPYDGNHCRSVAKVRRHNMSCVQVLKGKCTASALATAVLNLFTDLACKDKNGAKTPEMLSCAVLVTCVTKH
jgi:hypothetical protein